MKAPTKIFDYNDPAECMKRYAPLCFDIPHGHYPCRGCGGRGWFYDPDDPPDPVEGYKMCRRLKCPACGGKKYSTSKEDAASFKTWVKNQKKRYSDEVKQYKNHKKLLKSALIKLSPEEIEALKKEYRNGY